MKISTKYMIYQATPRIYTVKLLINARAFIINNAFSIESDGHLLEATLSGNIQAIIYRI